MYGPVSYHILLNGFTIKENKVRKATVEMYDLQYVTRSEVEAVGIHKSVTPFTLSKY